MKTVDGIVEMEEKQAAESKLVAFESAWGEISWKAELGWTMSRQAGVVKYSIPATDQHTEVSKVRSRMSVMHGRQSLSHAWNIDDADSA